MLPLVSIQIPTYNQKKYIIEAIESVLQQSYQNIEIIIADDASPDFCIFDHLDDYVTNPKIKVLRNLTNLGRVGNYKNCLYNHVNGEFFINLDGDDYLTDRNHITDAVKIISANSFDFLMYQANHNILKTKNAIKFREIDDTTIQVDSLEYIINWAKIDKFNHAATIFNTLKAKEIGFYNFDCVFSDFNSAAKLWLNSGKLILSSKKVSFWRVHGGNETFNLNRNNYKQEIDSLKDIKRFAKDRLDVKVLNSACDFHRNKIYNAVIGYLTKKGDFKETILFMLSYTNFSLNDLKRFLKLPFNI